jgi:hypothetical protein
VIGHDGAVVEAANESSDLADASVVSCITKAFTVLTFPRSGDATLTVVYPIVFRVDAAEVVLGTSVPIAPIHKSQLRPWLVGHPGTLDTRLGDASSDRIDL